MSRAQPVRSPLRVLFVEDVEDDAMLLVRELERAHDVVWARVDTEPAMQFALAGAEFDLIISDWAMPTFDALSAFRTLRALGLDIPFLIVSGTVSEELAVEALKAGVHDFLSKDRLARFLPAVRRELIDAKARAKRRTQEVEIQWQRDQLSLSEQRLRVLVESVPEGVLLVEPDGRIAIANRALASFGFPPGATRTGELRAAVELFLPDKVTPAASERLPVARALGGESVDGEELFFRHAAAPAGQWVSISARPVRDPSGKVVGAVATYRDTTRDRSAQEQLMISDRMASVGILAAGVAHEINNPLAAALMNLELAELELARPGTDPAVREMVHDALEAVDRVKDIVKDLKIFARHEEVAPGAVVLEQVLDSSLRMAWNELRHRAHVVRDYAHAPAVYGAEAKLGQVFLNLIVNAAQAIEPGKADQNQIRVSARATGDATAVIEISDTGSGIPPEVLARLFTPFVTTKPIGVGTGLGLTICQRIVTAYGGQIAVETELGKGTTFRVTLPLATPNGAPRAAPAAPASELDRRARILVVDDDAIVGNAISRALGTSHDVVVENRARKALDRITGGAAFDLIICDLMMPEMTGMEFHAALLAAAPALADRVVFMTGGAFTPSARRFLEEIANPRLEKPFDPRELRAVVSRLVPPA